MSKGLWISKGEALAAVIEGVVYPYTEDSSRYGEDAKFTIGSHNVNDGGPWYTLRVDVDLYDGRYYIAIGDEALNFLADLKRELEAFNR